MKCETIVILVLGLVLQGCVKYDDPIGYSPLPLSPYSLTFNANGGEGVVKGLQGYSIIANSLIIDNKGVIDDGDKQTPLVNQWCTVVYNGTSSTVQVSPNETGKERRCEIGYADTGRRHFNVVTVVQSGD